MVQSNIGCAKIDCVKPAYVGDGENNVVKTVGKHNHSATAARLEAKIAKHNMKVKSVSTQDAPRTILCKNTSNMTESALSELPSTSSLSRSIRRWRQTEDSAPPIPQERHGYLIPEQYCNTENGLKFLV